MATLTGDLLKEAVHHHPRTTRRGALERLFTWWFKGFVYNQIWEDPLVDAQALAIDAHSRILTIASGGCNVLNYLQYRPEKIVAIDLNAAHMALTRLKLAALRTLPDHDAFFQFFGHGKGAENLENYHRHIRPRLDGETRAFWDGRNAFQERHITYFKSGFYNRTRLGNFLRTAHALFGALCEDPGCLLKMRTMAEQEAFFNARIAPFFDRAMVKWLSDCAVTVFSLGIPPGQHQVLRDESGGDLVSLFRERLRQLICAFPIQDNYFAWQAFGRQYDTESRRAVPDYLRPECHDMLRAQAHRVETHVTSLIPYLRSQPDNALNKFVLLDAQDWMRPEEIRALWKEIARVGQPGTHIIFRTAGRQSPVEWALPADLRRRFAYCIAESRRLHARDRSAIYGMFHLYYLVY